MTEDRSPAARALLSRKNGLDGLRALCLLAVLLFHSDFRWAQGGFLGVTAFFVLSGFLITGLLVLERQKTGTLSLPGFWARRARRLAPGVLVLFVLVIAYLRFGATKMPAGVAGDGFASAFWFANWRFTFAHRSYAALFSGSSPFEHMWSLSVEEQVYLVLPLIVFFALGRRAGPARRVRLAVIFGVLVAASTAVNILLHHPGQQPLHEYYGTDARAAEPLVGALLALLLFGAREVRQFGRSALAALDGAALVALGGLIFMLDRLSQDSDVLYRGGFLLAACLSAVLVAAATQPGLVGRALSARPLRAVGRVSYGGYLFHWPIFLWMTHERTGLEGWGLFIARVAATLALATVSYKLVEQPIRLGRIRWPEVGPAWSIATVLALAGVVLVANVAVGTANGASKVAVGSDFHPTYTSLAPSTTVLGSSSTTTATTVAALRASVAGSPSSTAATARPVATSPATASRSVPTTTTRPPSHSGASGFFTPVTPPSAPPPTPNPNALRVAVVGDSMADGLAYGLEQWASTRTDVVVYDLAIPACPISRGGVRRFPSGYLWPVATECGWWNDPSSDRSQELAQFRPQVIVMQDGMNELLDRKASTWTDYQHTGEPSFDNWLLSEYQAALKVFTGNNSYHARVLSLNTVCADWDLLGYPWSGYDNGTGQTRVASLDADAAELTIANTQDVNYESYLCPNGQFTQTVAGVQNARPDGYHLSQAAATAVAQQWLGPMIMSQGGTLGLSGTQSTTPSATTPKAG